MVYRIILFLIINFIGLGLGAKFTTAGVASAWYNGLAKAPWTPPGWVFGFTWTLIMICFAIYLALLWRTLDKKAFLIGLFGLQWLLNFSWNPVFFYYHQVGLGLFIITALTLLIGFFLFYFYHKLHTKSVLLLPYFTWLLIATSLNAYILVMNYDGEL